MEKTKKSGFGTASLVLGIIAICFSFIPIVSYVSFILGVLAIIFSIVSLCKKSSKGVAIAGLILAVIALYMAYSMHKGLETVVNEVGGTIENITKEEKVECNQGEEGILGNGAITVTKVERSKGDKWNKPSSGKEYVIVTVNIKNKGTEKLSYNPFYFKMQNSQGQQQDKTFTTIDNDTALISGELVSGGNITGTLTFEEPVGDNNLALIYSDSIWSSKELKINLK